MSYPVHMDRRPWKFAKEVLEKIRELGPKWLLERGGIVVYQNGDMCSSHLGDMSVIPAKYIAEDDKMHDAPPWHESGTGCCSRRQQAVDHIMLEQYPLGEVEKAMEAFAEEDPPLKPPRARRRR